MKDPMLSKPAPTPLDGPLRSEKDISTHRRIYCGHYHQCLNESIRRGWAAFTCVRCPISEGPGKEANRLSAAEQRKGDHFNR